MTHLARATTLAAIALAAASLAVPAQASTIVYVANLSAANEVPVNSSPGTGSAVVTIDDVADTMRVQVSFQDLTGPNTAAHIHCCTAVAGAGTAGVATPTPTFPGFPGAASGSYDTTFDMTLASSFRAGYITANGGTPSAAFDALAAGLAAGTAYLNIHTQINPGGEIRGFLTAVPEPSTYALMALGLGAVLAARRRSRRA